MRVPLVLAMFLTACATAPREPAPASPREPTTAPTVAPATTSAPTVATNEAPASPPTAPSSPPPPPPPPLGEQPEIPGVAPLPPTTSKSDLALQQLRAKFKACYAKSLASDPDTKGAVKVTVSTDATGKVTSAKVVCSTFPKELTECVRKAYLGAQLGDGPATITSGGPC